MNNARDTYYILYIESLFQTISVNVEKVDIFQTVEEVLTQYLVQNKMRRTPERYAILRTIYEQQAPFTVDQIFQLMDKASYHVSHVTIYSALTLFITLGLVVPCPSARGEFFEKCYGVRDHFQQICTYCGRVSDFRSQVVTNALTYTHFIRFRPEHISICAYGICSKCQARLTRQYKKFEREQQQKGGSSPITKSKQT